MSHHHRIGSSVKISKQLKKNSSLSLPLESQWIILWHTFFYWLQHPISFYYEKESPSDTSIRISISHAKATAWTKYKYYTCLLPSNIVWLQILDYLHKCKHLHLCRWFGHTYNTDSGNKQWANLQKVCYLKVRKQLWDFLCFYIQIKKIVVNS